MVQQFFEKLLDVLRVRTHLDEMLVHVDGMDGQIPLEKLQFVVGDDESIGLQQGTEPHDDALGPDLDIAGVEVVVQKEQVVDLHTGVGNVEFWGTDATQGKHSFSVKGLPTASSIFRVMFLSE